MSPRQAVKRSGRQAQGLRSDVDGLSVTIDSLRALHNFDKRLRSVMPGKVRCAPAWLDRSSTQSLLPVETVLNL